MGIPPFWFLEEMFLSSESVDSGAPSLGRKLGEAARVPTAAAAWCGEFDPGPRPWNPSFWQRSALRSHIGACDWALSLGHSRNHCFEDLNAQHSNRLSRLLFHRSGGLPRGTPL